ncbi:YfhO family protein [Flavobacterium soyangense]|uniref:YfhO family protein n=1 Tax=Flavobacterium soyangense TaxID=2023265 RepID=A0A930UAU7_9FLAO|nr:YfhO family protein [Flavobacterium soyangense]MBF2708054.1 YfhO family protein [Flavobacterium soyangense]
MKQLQKLYPHALVLLGFVFISLIYFYPVLQGKQILQSDISQYTGMAKEQNDFRASEHQEPYWTNSAFGGMPTYQLGAKYPHDYIGMIDDAIRFLPRPADYLFLYFLGFYGLLLVLKVDPLKAFFGALAFGFSTYLIIILGVGHNAKAHAIGYMPLVIAGFIMVFQRKYIWGGLLTMFAVALEINANHFQMTYYLLIFLLLLSGYFMYQAVKEKQYKSLLTSFGVLAIAGIFAIGANATNLLATAEYANFSTRGKSELTFNADGTKNVSNSALSRDYITEYSYGIAESFNLIAPRLFGGSNSEALGKDSNMYSFMMGQGVPEAQANDFVSGMPTYWGDQPIVAAPAYIGIVVFFLGILALFTDKRKIKYVFLSGAIFALVLSWGKNFPILTNFFIDSVPMFNKFRAVSSIQVILELCFPVLAIMGLQSFFKLEKVSQFKALWQSAAVGFGIIIGLFLLKGSFSFAGTNDSYFRESYGPGFVDALKADRMTLYSADLLRSGFFMLLVAGVFWLFIKNKLAQNTTIILVGLLIIFDLFFVDKKYVSGKDFVSKREVEVPFQETPADAQILQDTTHYRVFEVSGNLSSARASYFHKSIGGYSAVKPRRMQQLFDYQIAKNNIGILNMLNVKYIIQTDSTGNSFPVQNPNANGNAWFVEDLKLVNKPDDVMKALGHLDTKKVAVFNVHHFGSKLESVRLHENWDTNGTIKLDIYKPNYLKYTSENSGKGLAVFSEIYYEKGWNAYIDGKKTDHFLVDYVLRAMEVPAGKHVIEFKFEPQVIKTGSTITLISSIGMLFLLIGGVYFEQRKKKQE